MIVQLLQFYLRFILNQKGAIMTRAEVEKIVSEARAKGEIPDLSKTDLSRANLYGANLSKADLSGTDLCGANLSRANLSGANLAGANLAGANLYGAKYSQEQIPSILTGLGLIEKN
jgi:uncharacterized protein YjbI with pentapeptide repeats